MKCTVLFFFLLACLNQSLITFASTNNKKTKPAPLFEIYWNNSESDSESEDDYVDPSYLNLIDHTELISIIQKTLEELNVDCHNVDGPMNLLRIHINNCTCNAESLLGQSINDMSMLLNAEDDNALSRFAEECNKSFRTPYSFSPLKDKSQNTENPFGPDTDHLFLASLREALRICARKSQERQEFSNESSLSEGQESSGDEEEGEELELEIEEEQTISRPILLTRNLRLLPENISSIQSSDILTYIDLITLQKILAKITNYPELTSKLIRALLYPEKNEFKKEDIILGRTRNSLYLAGASHLFTIDALNKLLPRGESLRKDNLQHVYFASELEKEIAKAAVIKKEQTQ